MYLDANNFYGWTMSQKLPVNGFEWVEELSQFIEDFIKDYDENSDEGYFLKLDVKYAKDLFNIQSDLPFLPERKKIKKCNKLVCNMHEKENFVIHIRALKQALNHRLIRKKSTRSNSIQSKRIEAKNDFEMDFFKLMNNLVFEKIMENVRTHRDIKLVTANKRRYQIAAEPNYHTPKYISKALMARKMKEPKVKVNRPIYLGMSV